MERAISQNQANNHRSVLSLISLIYGNFEFMNLHCVVYICRIVTGFGQTSCGCGHQKSLLPASIHVATFLANIQQLSAYGEQLDLFSHGRRRQGQVPWDFHQAKNSFFQLFFTHFLNNWIWISIRGFYDYHNKTQMSWICQGS